MFVFEGKKMNIPAFPRNIRCSHRNLDNVDLRGTHEGAAKHRLRKWEKGVCPT